MPLVYTPGPLRLFLDADLPRPTIRASFAAIVAGEAAALGLADIALAARQSMMAPALASPLMPVAALDLAAARGELVSQLGAVDPAIASVAAAAGVLEGELAGLTNEAAQDVGAVPGEPGMGDWEYPGGSQPPPRGPRNPEPPDVQHPDPPPGPRPPDAPAPAPPAPPAPAPTPAPEPPPPSEGPAPPVDVDEPFDRF